MRILFIGDIRQSLVSRWALYMKSKGHEIEVIATSGGTLSDIPIHTIGVNYSSTSATMKYYQQYQIQHFKKQITRKGKFDIVHIHCPFTGCEHWGGWVHPHTIISWWRSSVQIGENTVYSPKWTRENFEQAAAVSVPYAMMYEQIKSVVADSKHVELIPTGIDIKKFEGFDPRSSRREHFGFCFARPIHPNWGPDLAIDAFARIAEELPQAGLMLLGEGEEKYVALLKNRVSQKGLYNRVYFSGRVTEAEYLAILKKSHVFVHPYRVEGYALGLLEAMAAGLPAVITAGEEISDVIIEETTGLTFPAEDVEKMAEKMLYMAQNNVQRLQMGRNARDLVTSLYSFELHAERMIGLYNEVQSGAYDQKRGWKSSIKRVAD